MHLHLLFRFACSPSSGVRVSRSDSLGPFQGFGRGKHAAAGWSAVGDKDCEALQALDLFV